MTENGHIFRSNFAVYLPIYTRDVPIDPASRPGLGMLKIVEIGSYLTEQREFEKCKGSMEVHVSLVYGHMKTRVCL